MNNLLTISCKNPNCKNIFQLHQSLVGRKVYCSRQCRSAHHWNTTPLFEKICRNPSCNTIIKRKFKQQIEKIYYCSPICRKNHKKQLFEKSLNDIIKSNCRVCSIELITKREPCGKLIPRKICDECNKKENQLKAEKMTKMFSYLYNNDPIFRQNKQRQFKEIGLKMKEKHKIYGLPEKWKKWYCQFCSYGKSKLEDVVVNIIKQKISKIERSYPISNIFVDIYVPEKNLVIECLGDYWHMNPKKYSPTDLNKSTKRTAQEQWEKDKRRKLFLESLGYKVIEIWESEINNGDYSKLNIYM